MIIPPPRKALLDVTRRLVSCGLSIFPIRADGSKAPAGRLLPLVDGEYSWNPYRERQPTDDELRRWWDGWDRLGIAIICGAISRGLEAIDFEAKLDLTGNRLMFDAWLECMIDMGYAELVERLMQVRTPSGGRHLLYRCAVIGTCAKLAMRPAPTPENPDNQLTLIEVKSEGGYILGVGSPPACHPTGKTYDLLTGSFDAIPIITPDERQILLDTARSLDESPPANELGAFSGFTGTACSVSIGDRVGDDFNRLADWMTAVLGPHGWTIKRRRGEKLLVARPGVTNHNSATINYKGNDLLHVFSSSANPFEQGKSYSKFAAYTLLNHGGDFRAAAKALAKQGYGTKDGSQTRDGNMNNAGTTEGSATSGGATGNSNNGKTDDTASAWPESKPLTQDLPAQSPYPVDALGPMMAPAVKAFHRVIKAPLSLCAHGVLAISNSVAQVFANVLVDGRSCPISEYFLTIALSGERKSAVDTPAALPIRDWEEKKRAEYNLAHQRYTSELELFKAERKAIIASNQMKSAAKKIALAELKPPDEPLPPFFLVSDPTPEGVQKLLAVGAPAIGVFTDEAASFFHGYSMQPETQLRTAACFSSWWDGKPGTRVRGGDGVAAMGGKRVAAHWLAQPVVAARFYRDPDLRGQGLLARILTSWPESTAGTRMYCAEDLTKDGDVHRFHGRIQELLLDTWPLSQELRGELRPTNLELDSTAKELWIAFHNTVEQQLARGGQLSSIREFASKAAEHALRLAGTIHIIEVGCAGAIAVSSIRCAIELTEWYLNEALRLTTEDGMVPNLTEAAELLTWLQKRNISPITLVEIYSDGPMFARSAEHARLLMTILADHGWVRPSTASVTFREHICRECFRIRPDTAQ